jgi:alcohol dehydrogenase YqhD (iron-dependent ADH family)
MQQSEFDLLITGGSVIDGSKGAAISAQTSAFAMAALPTSAIYRIAMRRKG